MSQLRRRRVCLFGLSADPPTGVGGHVGIVKALSVLDDDNDTGVCRFDEVRILPVYRHTFSAKRYRLAPYEHRVAMCQLAFQHIPRVNVSQQERTCFERNAEGLTTQEELSKLHVGTADLLDMLLEAEPDTDFSFALGADTFLDLTDWKWKRSRHVMTVLQGRFVVFQRQESDAAAGTPAVASNAILDRIDRINREEHAQVRLLTIPTLTSVSSTLIRSCCDEQALRDMVVPTVLEYMKTNKLYGFSEFRSQPSRDCR